MRTVAMLLSILLSGCASTVVIDSSPSLEAATVAGQLERIEGLANWRAFSLIAVDDKVVKHGFLADQHDTVVKLAPGNRRIVVQARFNSGYGSAGPWEAIVLLQAPVEAGKRYRVTGAVRDNIFYVWLEDPETRSKVSAEASAPYVGARSNSYYVPVYVPAK